MSLMASALYGAQRNRTDGDEHLIGDDERDVYRHTTTTAPQSIAISNANRRSGNDLAPSGMRFSTLSDCSSYYGLPNAANENQQRYVLHAPYLRANVRVIIGSILLTLVGCLLICLGIFATFVPNDFDNHGGGWIFLVVGILFFIPGAYHVFYIVCALFNRPGYEYANWPSTFTHPPPT